MRPPALASCLVPSVHVSPPSSDRYRPRVAPDPPAPRPPVPASAYKRRPCVPDATANVEIRSPSESPRTPAGFHVTPPSVDLKTPDAACVPAGGAAPGTTLVPTRAKTICGSEKSPSTSEAPAEPSTGSTRAHVRPPSLDR